MFRYNSLIRARTAEQVVNEKWFPLHGSQIREGIHPNAGQLNRNQRKQHNF